ncbi:hypothetical protein MA16_Dca016845 [Dendrobium catenatum]|uniref:Reverse transcriptase zinc-binding domain-containing protein n=1 Tax=Dendrobium catenatum TaxID=906689 RepID=A0A2I0WNP8_9ASPA|nr:hypothetical protein MA16_Dca016845 [Dendrobium catenatum]
MTILNGLKTLELLIKRNFIVPNNCILYNKGPEYHRHLFFECDFSFNIISNFVHGLNFFMLRPNLMKKIEFSWHSN